MIFGHVNHGRHIRLSPGNTHNTPRPNFGKLGDDSSNENLDGISRLIFVCSVLI